MYQILKKRKLSEKICLMKIRAERIARKCMPGEFLIIRIDEQGERIPLTICDYNREEGTVVIVVQVVGATSYRLVRDFNEGDSIADVVGPLGNPSDLTKKTPEELKKMHILFVAGGLGAAPVYPQVKWLVEQGIIPDVVQGSKTKDMVILEKEMRALVGDHLYVTTDDGTYGFHGMVTAQVEDLVKNQGKKYDHCVAIGPMVMMKFVAKLTKELGIPTVASMDPIMVDGTGMCGACRLLVGGEVKFACVDGPEFDAHQVDFDQAIKRARMYRTEEGRAFLKAQEGETHHGGCGNCGGEA